jgi:hypothetical protein
LVKSQVYKCKIKTKQALEEKFTASVPLVLKQSVNGGVYGVELKGGVYGVELNGGCR